MDLYEQYHDLQKQIDALTAEQKEVRAAIEQNLPIEGYKTDFITASWTIKPKWTYSPQVKELESNVKAVKKHEEETGIAQLEEQKILNIRVK